MTIYGLDYTDDAEKQLARAWLYSNDRNGVTRSQHVIDQVLASDPRLGKHLSEGLWRIIIPPLVAYFEINESVLQVTVTNFGLVK